MSRAQLTLFDLSTFIPSFPFNQLELLGPTGSGYSYKGRSVFPGGGGLPEKSEFDRFELPVIVRDLRKGCRDDEETGGDKDFSSPFKLASRRFGFEMDRDRDCDWIFLDRVVDEDKLERVR